MPDISIGRLRGGFCVYWDDPVTGARRRYQLAACDRKAAEAEAVDVYRRETKRQSGETVEYLWESYRRDLGDKPTAKTMGYTGKAVLPFFGSLRPDQITRDLCRKYDKERRKQGKSQGTIHTELGHLRSALKFALGSQAPFIWRPNKPDSDIRILNAGEVRRLIECCEAPHTKLAVILLFGTAGRVGAILDLTWDRVDFDRGTINLRVTDSATRKGRAVVPMNSMTRAALSAAAEAALSDYVIEWGGDRISSLRTGIVAAMARAGIENVRIHDFRHTAAVTMLGAGMRLELVSQILGHSNTATTQKVYARFLPEHMQDAINVLNFTTVRSVGV